LRLSMRYAASAQHGFTISVPDETPISFAGVKSIWWRRPQPFSLDRAIEKGSHRTFAYNESIEAFAGLWQALDVFWINHPTRDDVGARKAYQLRVAQQVGLDIPDTLISNDPDTVREWVAARGPDNVIYKSFSATPEEWRETRLLKIHELDLVDNVRFAPVIFQEYIPAAVDLRITAVAGQFFPAAIHSQETSYVVDFRMDMASARVECCELPADVKAGLSALMKRLGLVYGAIDMRLTPQGRYVFLEINPAGQWLFIEQRTGQPITAAVAQALTSREP
jgi:glutathione synthase/RimK-type ligase-like ATP-grasp enzyme